MLRCHNTWQLLILHLVKYQTTNVDGTTSLTAFFTTFSFLAPQLRDYPSNRAMILIVPLLDGKMQDRCKVCKDKDFTRVFQCALTISVQVVSLIGPASGLGWVAGGRIAASAVLCQEVSQSEGLPLLILFLS